MDYRNIFVPSDMEVDYLDWDREAPELVIRMIDSGCIRISRGWHISIYGMGRSEQPIAQRLAHEFRKYAIRSLHAKKTRLGIDITVSRVRPNVDMRAVGFQTSIKEGAYDGNHQHIFVHSALVDPYELYWTAKALGQFGISPAAVACLTYSKDALKKYEYDEARVFSVTPPVGKLIERYAAQYVRNDGKSKVVVGIDRDGELIALMLWYLTNGLITPTDEPIRFLAGGHGIPGLPNELVADPTMDLPVIPADSLTYTGDTLGQAQVALGTVGKTANGLFVPISCVSKRGDIDPSTSTIGLIGLPQETKDEYITRLPIMGVVNF